ncbi:UDP-4-amino-4-deoxy-l-arabinose--oxoglutarate aminotransferase [Plakobranchus ocellatus]|uniref:UDP-4-amino-4-deoxy-l-arabinose--oxoglutarate aminotransferase n=1 Tax=Plakobranchus ocellatus TaxID=259542 RepID=A0AAV4DEI8_9GAST|nr:UDP-4-amino-4-deoxy-l-arabinose--oxoglutarate aminotransferase [Plakobranchus ocellatus]
MQGVTKKGRAFPNLPYSAVIIDSTYSRLLYAARQCFVYHTQNNRAAYLKQLQQLWAQDYNSNPVMPCLCVRTAFDLFLQVKQFPPGSEVIMTAINIKDMPFLLQHHKLRVVPVDMDPDTLEPDMVLMERLVTQRTVAILVAHLYGRIINMEPVLSLAQKHNLSVIEDCAECFSGFSHVGDPRSDISLFSFGIIKFSTSFGGGIAKVRDPKVYEKMVARHKQYPVQTCAMYLKKILKYIPLYTILHVWPFPAMVQKSREMGVDWKDTFVSFLRGFPNNLVQNIRYQPSSALLCIMAKVQSEFNPSELALQRVKCEYFLSNLPPSLKVVGTKSQVNHFWLFPVLVEKPDLFISCLAALGVDAYRGATQLNYIEPDGPNIPLGPPLPHHETLSPLTPDERYPHRCRDLIEHVVYMPVNKYVPFYMLEQMARVCRIVMLSMEGTAVHGSESMAVETCKTIKSKL